MTADATARQREGVARFVRELEADGDAVAGTLSEAEFGTFEALSAVLGHHQGNYYHAARFFKAEWSGEFEETQPLEDLIELLGLLAIAAGGVVLVFLPFVVLLSYALRIATIAARTADFGPFIPRRPS
ncbi:hypothetical protein [Natrialba asiatica]|uniref:Uncharacterized protein n=1 Tax=Natrialba asiatica (strain ATCC 700177 / DSM 12278 / JCM 9576 / FERM P-10747 / NBRC 102637 / 172P1) TaxID=29540 RepID=M0AQ28_NATA1|nr:hypothetical protein [Natrialba asiatica]ELY99483.1 hypothetical protein C481_14658 [Natrialba asiatica DSM 12278]